MSSYKLVAFDMDGTLLNSSKKISEGTLKAINDAIDAGKIVVLSTGRCIAELREYFELLPKLRYVICMSGALVYDVKEKVCIYSNAIPQTEVRLILKEALKRDVMVQFHTVEESIVERERGLNIGKYGMAEYQELYDRVATKVEDITAFYDEYDQPVYKVNIYHLSRLESSFLKEELEEYIKSGDLNLELVYSERTSLECSRTGTTKGTGLIKLCEYLGISISETIGVGDADNDIDMLSKVGLSVAMGNANSNVKAVSKVVVADNDHEGCAEVIQKFLM